MANATLPAQSLFAAFDLFTDVNNAALNARTLGLMLQEAAGNVGADDPAGDLVERVFAVSRAVENLLDLIYDASRNGGDLLLQAQVAKPVSRPVVGDAAAVS